jgi:hypothetical protein
MKPILLALATVATLIAPVVASADDRTRAEKQGALERRADPARDLAVQRANVEKLEENARRDRADGNHVGAWAAERDARHARKLVREDEARLRHPRQASDDQRK